MAAANLIVVSGFFLTGTSPTLADSKSNTWTAMTLSGGSTSGAQRMWYCYNPTTDAAHTFSLNGTATYASLSVVAFSGAQASPLDQEGAGQDSTTNAVTTQNTAAITTGQANTIVIAVLGDNAPPSGTATINTTGAGAVITQQLPLSGGNSFANVLTYHILTGVEVAYQPQFGFSSTTNAMNGIASFKHDGTGAFVASTIKQGDLNGSGTSPAINTAGVSETASADFVASGVLVPTTAATKAVSAAFSASGVFVPQSDSGVVVAAAFAAGGVFSPETSVLASTFAQFSAQGVFLPRGPHSFSIDPSSGHATGSIAITADGTDTHWTSSNPFSVTVGGGFATISGYNRISDTSATFNLVLSSLGGTVTILDSDSGVSQDYDASAVAPTKPLSVVISDNHDDTITVTFSPPADAGGAAITSYTATSSSGGVDDVGASSPIIISGINKGVLQHVNVTATNSAGTSPSSDDSNSITPVTVPDAPTSPVATASATLGQASVAFDAPADDGGTAILTYAVTSSPGGVIEYGASSPVVVTGLNHATAYTFTVAASNAQGLSASSVASNQITTNGFRITPTGATTTGVKAITATGFGTTWGVGNPFAVDSGPGSLADYANVNGTSATFNLTVSALSGVPIIISDSGTGGSGSTVSFSTRINDAASYFAPSGSGRGSRSSSTRARGRNRK